jgi:hypothetical protein
MASGAWGRGERREACVYWPTSCALEGVLRLWDNMRGAALGLDCSAGPQLLLSHARGSGHPSTPLITPVAGARCCGALSADRRLLQRAVRYRRCCCRPAMLRALCAGDVGTLREGSRGGGGRVQAARQEEGVKVTHFSRALGGRRARQRGYLLAVGPNLVAASVGAWPCVWGGASGCPACAWASEAGPANPGQGVCSCGGLAGPGVPLI